ncbi:MAG: HAD family hydrolase [Acidimicrobiia bacterium]|nr:HAD family hydrolase [Acidimicrobiia bacterium]
MVESQAIDGVVFDIGGVFLVPHPEPIGEALADAGLEAPAEPDRYREAHYRGARALTDLLSDNGHVDDTDHDVWASYDRGYFSTLGVADDDLDRAHGARQRQRTRGVMGVWRLDLPVNITGFHRLAAAGMALAIVSNNDGTAAQQMVEHGVCQVGDGPLPSVATVVDSTVVGVAKPDPAIFSPAVDALGAPPERLLYVGDTVHADVRGATAAGMQAVQLDPFDLHREFDHPRVADVGALASILLD